MAKIIQSIGDVEETIHVLFMPEAPYTKTVKKPLTAPETMSCVASVTSEKGFFKYDALSEDFSVGVFDDRYKPAAEYPVSGVDNAVLDLSYTWRVENKVYPLPLPSGLNFYSMETWIATGFLSYEGKLYKDPTADTLAYVYYRIRNLTGSTIRVEHWGLPLSVLYDDNKRVSQYDVSVSLPARNIYNGRDYGYSFAISLPDWCYGRIAVAHAVNVYKDGMFIYGGGPLWCLECFRLLLP